MIGLGGWDDRTKEHGPYVYYNNADQLVRDTSEGIGGSHGPRYPFVLTARDETHPIMKDIPRQWLHVEDELYDRLRGPANNITVLATAYSDVEINRAPWDTDFPGSGRHEPMLMTIRYGQGRIFHTALGHNDYSMECVGFITTLQRGAEWAATGAVSQPVPQDFPSVDQVKIREWE